MITAHAIDESAVGYYRIRFVIDAINKQGGDVKLNLIPKVGTAQEGIFQLSDVVVCHTPTSTLSVLEIIRAKNAGCKVVVDIDDDYTRLDGGSWMFQQLHSSNAGSNAENILAGAQFADVLTVSTPRLAEVYKEYNDNIVVLENCVPEWYLDIGKAERHQWGLGWGGNPTLHIGDLEEVGGYLNKYNVRVIIPPSTELVDVEEMTRKKLGLFDGFAEVRHWGDIGGEYQKMVSDFEVGLVPLRRNNFNDGKSWLKGLEYAALGVPFVASNTREYQRLEKMGAGVTVRKNQMWQREIKDLFGNDKRWIEAKEQGLGVASEWTYENNAKLWADVWGM